AGPYFDADHVGRGAAFGDLDDDGDLDIVVNHLDGSPAVLRNDTVTSHHWIRLCLQGTRSNRDAIGARVEVTARDRTIVRQRKGGASLGSAHDPRLLIGLGPSDRARRIVVRWPSGQVEDYADLPTGATFLIREGSGRAERLPGSDRRKEASPGFPPGERSSIPNPGSSAPAAGAGPVSAGMERSEGGPARRDLPAP